MVMVRLGLIAFVEKCCAIQAGEPGVDNPGRLAGCMHVDAFYCRGAVHEGCGDVHACGSMKRIVNINWDLGEFGVTRRLVGLLSIRRPEPCSESAPTLNFEHRKDNPEILYLAAREHTPSDAISL